MEVQPPPSLDASLPLEFEHGFEGLLGLVLTELGDDVARAQLTVREEFKQAAGIVHGGVYASIAETLASWATARAVMPAGKRVVGLSNQTSFLRPIASGTIHALATRKHGGRTTWVWEVEMSDDEGRLCVLTRMTIAVRDGA
jgi:1,4-dihydroxy-2-naphthoyl-CoA hydrolase